MNKRKRAHIATFVCITIVMLLCYYLSTLPTFNPAQLYYNDKYIVSQSDSYHSWGWVGSPADESGATNITIKKFSGAKTIRNLSIGEGGGNLSCEWNISVTGGKFKLVLVDIEKGEIVEMISEGTNHGNIDDYVLPPGEYQMKVVGNHATVEIRGLNIESSDINLI